MKKRMLALLLMVLSMVTLIACKSQMVVVSFDSNGGTEVESVEVKSGTILKEVPTTTKKGYTFQYWTLDGEEFDFSKNKIQKDMAVVAKWESNDKIPPAFIGAVKGELPELEHLKGHEVDLFENIRVRDETTKEENVELIISDNGNYDKDVPGVYKVVYQAKDEAGNISEAFRMVTVHDTLIKEYEGVVIGEKSAEYVLNQEDALEYTSSGTKFRSFDIIQVMEKDFFVEQYERLHDKHTNNALIPFFPNGVILVVDQNMKFKHARIAAGVLVEINEEGKINEEISWTNGVDAKNGGGMFKGFVEELNNIIPEGGYIMFVGNTPPEVSRKFLIQNLFNNSYEGGSINVGDFNVDVTKLDIKLEKVVIEVKLPDRLETPQVKIEKGILSWEEIKGSKEYQIKVDGEVLKTTTATSYDIKELNLEPKAEPYIITVVAITPDIFENTSSEESEAVEYIQKTVIETPEISVKGNVIEWESIEEAVSYEVYVEFLGEVIKLAKVNETSYDLTKHLKDYVGNQKVFIRAIAEDEDRNSATSNELRVFFGEVKTFAIGEVKTDILEMDALTYFKLRNSTFDQGGMAAAPFLILIKDIHEILSDDFGVDATEAYSTIVLLNSDKKVKVVNSIQQNRTYELGEGWFNNSEYATNARQIDSLKKKIENGDMLLIGKNSNMLTVYEGETKLDKTINARNFISHFYVRKNDDNNYNAEGWRQGMDTYLDPKDVEISIN